MIYKGGWFTLTTFVETVDCTRYIQNSKQQTSLSILPLQTKRKEISEKMKPTYLLTLALSMTAVHAAGKKPKGGSGGEEETVYVPSTFPPIVYC